MIHYSVTMAAMLLASLVFTSVVSVSGYISGAPEQACNEMIPGHPKTTTVGDSPFALNVSVEYYKPGSIVQGTVLSPSGEVFKGVLIQARRITGDKTERIGTFIPPENFRTACNEKALTHTNNNEKSAVHFTWVSPEEPQGDLHFRFTVVQQYQNPSKYWLDGQSIVIKDCASLPAPSEQNETNVCADLPMTTLPPTQAPTTPKVDNSIRMDSGCGNTKGCIGNCQNDICDYLYTWRDTGDEIEFEMSLKVSGSGEKWIAIGFSSDNKMGEDSVLACLSNGDDIVAEVSYNTASRKNEPFSNTLLGITGVSGSYQNGILYCKVTRVKVMSSDPKYFDLNKDWIALLAHGNAVAGTKSKHRDRPDTSEQTVDFQSTDLVGAGHSHTVFVTVHASLMVGAWVLFASVGIITANHCKDVLGDRRLCNEKVWFQIHRFCMVMTLLLTATSFILIFIEVKGYSDIHTEEGKDYTKAHPILGIIITALVLINPIMALFRPHPDGEYRYIFNRLHLAVGLIALILAAINIFFGLQLDHIEVPISAIYVWIIYVVVLALVDICLHIYNCRATNKKTAEKYEMSGTFKVGEVEMEAKADSSFKKIILSVHTLAMLGLALALIVIIATR